MAALYFLLALAGIVVFAIVVNRLTGTKANYLEALRLEAGERELWRDSAADFGTLPRQGQALKMSFPRLRRHTAVWTTRRLIIAQRALGSAQHLITHQIVFRAPSNSSDPDAGAQHAASQFAGGFYGRGFETLLAASHSFARVDDKDCLRVVLEPDSSAASNLIEVYLFSDRLAELREALAH